MSLYALRKSPLGFSITKFDTDFNPEATYTLISDHANGIFSCSCPAGPRPSCRHRLMLPRMLWHVDDGWFYNYETQKWHRPLVEEAQLAIETSPNAEGASSPSNHSSLAGEGPEPSTFAADHSTSPSVSLRGEPAPATGNIRRRV